MRLASAVLALTLVCCASTRERERLADASTEPDAGPAPVPIDAGPPCPSVRARIRDFRTTHPDFAETELGYDPGIVAEELAVDGLPVYLGPTRTTHGREAFDQWFRDVPGVNEAVDVDLPVEPGGYLTIFDDRQFFPIDDRLFGSEGRSHNHHFTAHVHTEFTYGATFFYFGTDSDLFVFINGHLVVDYGGMHTWDNQAVDLYYLEGRLGLERGSRYSIDVFFANRHSDGSQLRFEMRIDDLAPCPD